MRAPCWSSAIACANCAYAETRVYLLRGWFGVFSTGMDTMAEELRAKGVKAEAIGHLEWKSAALKIVDERAAGITHRIALIGHSQGANNVIDMARELEKHGVVVDLLITLVPWLQDPVPSNVVRAINYYQSPGWGSPLTADPGFKGETQQRQSGRPGQCLPHQHRQGPAHPGRGDGCHRSAAAMRSAPRADRFWRGARPAVAGRSNNSLPRPQPPPR